jgi:hypothetical protein
LDEQAQTFRRDFEAHHLRVRAVLPPAVHFQGLAQGATLGLEFLHFRLGTTPAPETPGWLPARMAQGKQAGKNSRRKAQPCVLALQMAANRPMHRGAIQQFEKFHAKGPEVPALS